MLEIQYFHVLTVSQQLYYTGDRTHEYGCKYIWYNHKDSYPDTLEEANEKGGEDPKQYTVLLEEAKLVTQILKPKLRSKQ